MKTSMIMPIYNEERLLPYHLDYAAPYIDEIVLVDGGPAGPSTDSTKDLIEAKCLDNVIRIEGKFELKKRKGGWDKLSQIKAGVSKATGDILIIVSCDTVYSDYEELVNTINAFPGGQVYYCHLCEFFIDAKHLRLDPVHFPRPQISHIIFRRELFTTKNAWMYSINDVEPQNYVFLQDLKLFHYGWITDFDIQVRKHIRNVTAGLWGDFGEEILSAGEEALHVWAITHTSNYAQEVAFLYTGGKHPFNQLDFNYINGFDKALAQFKEKFNKTYYECM